MVSCSWVGLSLGVGIEINGKYDQQLRNTKINSKTNLHGKDRQIEIDGHVTK